VLAHFAHFVLAACQIPEPVQNVLLVNFFLLKVFLASSLQYPHLVNTPAPIGFETELVLNRLANCQKDPNRWLHSLQLRKFPLRPAVWSQRILCVLKVPVMTRGHSDLCILRPELASWAESRNLPNWKRAGARERQMAKKHFPDRPMKPGFLSSRPLLSALYGASCCALKQHLPLVISLPLAICF